MSPILAKIDFETFFMLKMMETRDLKNFDAFMATILVSMATKCSKIVIFVDFGCHGNNKKHFSYGSHIQKYQFILSTCIT